MVTIMHYIYWTEAYIMKSLWQNSNKKLQKANHSNSKEYRDSNYGAKYSSLMTV